jgi:plasmid stabilization system protein ParE
MTPRALADAKRMKTWWRRNRPKAPDLFDDELDVALERLVTTPNLGSVYEQDQVPIEVRRLLMPRTHNHVYYAIEGQEIVVLSVWGAPKGRGPKL